jgi:hypothetical protein
MFEENFVWQHGWEEVDESRKRDCMTLSFFTSLGIATRELDARMTRVGRSMGADGRSGESRG